MFTGFCGFADIALLIDGSDSIQEQGANDWNKYLHFIKELVSAFGKLGGSIHISLTTFDNAGRVQQKFTPLKNFNLTRITSYPFFGGQGILLKGLRKVAQRIIKESGDRPNAPNALIVFSDIKVDQRNILVMEEARNLRIQGNRIVSVGLMKHVDEDIMRVIASNVQTDYINITDFKQPLGAIERILYRTCIPTNIEKPTEGKYIFI